MRTPSYARGAAAGSPRWPAAVRSASARPGVASRLWERTRRGFAEGNVPVKIGVLVLLAGVAALLLSGRLELGLLLLLDAGIALLFLLASLKDEPDR